MNNAQKVLDKVSELDSWLDQDGYGYDSTIRALAREAIALIEPLTKASPAESVGVSEADLRTFLDSNGYPIESDDQFAIAVAVMQWSAGKRLAPESREGARPANCGTSFCSCIECVATVTISAKDAIHAAVALDLVTAETPPLIPMSHYRETVNALEAIKAALEKGEGE